MIGLRLGILVTIWFASAALAFEGDTHNALSRRAVIKSSLPAFATEVLGVENSSVLGQGLEAWVGEGSEDEDLSGRFLNHFHQPLLSWDHAGLLPPFYKSSVIWAQQGGGAVDGTWRAARRNFYELLTSSDSEQRDVELVELLKSLGHQIHLIQDAAVTAHTRGDPHPREFFDPEPLEVHTDWVRVEQPSKFSAWIANVERPSPTLLTQLPTNPLTPVPIAHLIDTTDGMEVPGGAKTGPGFGLAEFTNTNFFSMDTILDPLFRFPRFESLGERRQDVAPPPGSVWNRYYRSKVADGVPVFRFVVEGALGPYFEAVPDLYRRTLSIDSRVAEDYAAILLPRAVGYSAALIDYFFRGDLALVTTGATGKRREPFAVENKGTEPIEGWIQVFYDDEDGGRHSVGNTQTNGELAPGARVPIAISWPSTPAPETPGEFLVVFKGRHGLEGLAANETDFAVIAARSNVPPPPTGPGADAGLSHAIVDPTHTHQGASASDANGDLASYTWSWASCPASCPGLSNASGGLSGGSSSVPVPGPTFTLVEGGPHTLKLEVRDAAGNRSSSTATHQLAFHPLTEGYRMSDGGYAWYPYLSAWAWWSNDAFVGEPYEWDEMYLTLDADHDVFVQAEPFIRCDVDVESPCGEVVSTNFQQALAGHEPGMVFRTGESFQLQYLVNFTKPGDHELGVRFDTVHPYWYGEWYVILRVQ